MVFNTTFNNSSAISWQSVLLMEETGESGEIHRPAASSWQTLPHNVVLSTPGLIGIWTHNVYIKYIIIDKWQIIHLINKGHVYTTYQYTIRVGIE